MQSTHVMWSCWAGVDITPAGAHLYDGHRENKRTSPLTRWRSLSLLPVVVVSSLTLVLL